ncbi:hypothetical protein TNCT_15281 [Trichonephila clavata]|uniref:Uncharacterized protein n=1 Tax=Trichonephila clavata TaxID=2740835 RepID=A0A8X6KG86_TRICU|nr:hypothetical protein TNCT_15281 [Trichonephila clavata]
MRVPIWKDYNLLGEKTLTVTLDNNLLNNILSVYISFEKNYVFLVIFRFSNNCKNPSNNRIGSLKMPEIQLAEIPLLKLVHKGNKAVNGIQLGDQIFVQ